MIISCEKITWSPVTIRVPRGKYWVQSCLTSLVIWISGSCCHPEEPQEKLQRNGATGTSWGSTWGSVSKWGANDPKHIGICWELLSWKALVKPLNTSWSFTSLALIYIYIYIFKKKKKILSFLPNQDRSMTVEEKRWLRSSGKYPIVLERIRYVFRSLINTLVTFIYGCTVTWVIRNNYYTFQLMHSS
mgnify:CR=1 FL=1